MYKIRQLKIKPYNILCKLFKRIITLNKGGKWYNEQIKK